MTDACRKSTGCGKRRVSGEDATVFSSDGFDRTDHDAAVTGDNVTRADNKQVKLPAKERTQIGQPGHAVLEERKTTPEEHPEPGPENTHNSNGKCIVKYTEYS
jgi:hypothetical protein